jgi:hypothetical protein
MPSVVMPSVVMPSAVMPSVVAPFFHDIFYNCLILCFQVAFHNN